MRLVDIDRPLLLLALIASLGSIYPGRHFQIYAIKSVYTESQRARTSSGSKASSSRLIVSGIRGVVIKKRKKILLKRSDAFCFISIPAFRVLHYLYGPCPLQ